MIAKSGSCYQKVGLGETNGQCFLYVILLTKENFNILYKLHIVTK